MTFEKLIEELGAKLGIEFEDAGGAAAMEIDGAVIILQDAGELLLIRAEVGEIPADAKAQILLSATVNPVDGKLHIHKYNWLDRLDVDAVIDAMDKLSTVVAAWRRILSDCRPDAAPGDALPLGDGDEGRQSFGEGAFMQV